MFTKEQVRKISRYYIEPLFYRTSCIIGIDADEGLTNGHCYYYAERLVKFLQGKWRNVGTEYLSDEEKAKRNKEIGRVCSVNTDHYFVEYDGNYFDGEGIMYHTDNRIWLWRYENKNTDHAIDFPKSELYYQGEDAGFDAGANITMSYYKSAIWNIYDLVFEPFANELITKLEKAASDGNDVGFDAILTIYCNKSKDLIENDPAVQIKIQDIKKEVKEKDEEERKRWEKYRGPSYSERFKDTKKWIDLSPEETQEVFNSPEFREKFGKMLGL